MRCPLRCALCDDCVAELVRQTREAAAEEMTKALARARREALEEAAKVAEEHAKAIGVVKHTETMGGAMDIGHIDAGNEIAEAILALAGTPDATKEETT